MGRRLCTRRMPLRVSLSLTIYVEGGATHIEINVKGFDIDLSVWSECDTINTEESLKPYIP